ncbi:hypothetical protein [Lunatimonas lonarensis]|uniref:hypothetical protein n=1 Tax=Lunatimonas lonarensis TaxID=1232681 RepID=UPI0005659BF7|nr:hypothetical protein [Lunatimonas lonarensis]
MQNRQRWLAFYSVMLGFCLSIVCILWLGNRYHITSESPDFIVFSSFAATSISFLIGLIRYLPVKKNQSN